VRNLLFSYIAFTHCFLPSENSILGTSVRKKRSKSEEIVYFILTRFYMARRKLVDYKQSLGCARGALRDKI